MEKSICLLCEFFQDFSFILLQILFISVVLYSIFLFFPSFCPFFSPDTASADVSLYRGRLTGISQ